MSTSGYPSPSYRVPAPPNPAVETVRLLKFIAAMLQVLCALVAILVLMLAGWLLGIFPDFVSPLVEVRL